MTRVQGGDAEEAHLDALAAIRAALLDDTALVRAVGSGRQRNRSVPYRRVELRYVRLKAGLRLQVTSYDETQAHTRNVAPGADAERTVDDLLALPFSGWHVATATQTLQLRITKKGRPLLHRAAVETAAAPDLSHDRAKRRRLDASDPLFAALGITAADGSVRPTRVAKFRQVQDFLAALAPVVDDAVARGPGERLSADRPLRVADLGCGNAYLTFAAVRYLDGVVGIPVRAWGVDVKAQAREHNEQVAERLGLADRLEFVQAGIDTVELPNHPDLVLALHACDTATDDALARAVRWQAPVILAAPCCHHDIQRQLQDAAEPSAYRLVTRHGILRERFADVLTDALRAAVLRLVGYRVEVIEFVDSRHTPRNALIRAVRTGAPADEATVEAYRDLVAAWQVRPALARLLADLHPAFGQDLSR